MRSEPSSDGVEDRESVSTGSLDDRNVNKKIRVVIGLFDQPSNLLNALEALINKGFTSADLCVSGTIDTISMAGSMLHRNGANIDSALAALFTTTKPYEAKENSPTIVGSLGELFTLLNGLINQHQKSVFNGSCDDCDKITSEFIAHITKGRLVLIVGTDKPRQLIHASKTLLKFSPAVIQSHEFALA